MADSKITALTALTAADPANDMIPIVDVSDTPPASGNTKRISINNILACSPSATLASATISGDLTVDTNVLKVDSANDNVGIGTTTPASYAFNDPVKLAIANTGTAGAGNTFTIASGSTGFGQIAFANGTSGTSRYNGYIKYSHSTNAMEFYTTAGALQATLNSNGLGVGVASPSNRLEAQEAGTGSGLGGIVSSTATVGGNAGYVFRTGGTNRWSLSLTGSAGAESIRFYDVNNSATRLLIDTSGNVISNVTGTAPTLATNSQMVFNLTSNTNLRISVRGTDGVTRTANITLA